MMSTNQGGQNKSLEAGLLQPGVVAMLNRADPALVSQDVLDLNHVTAVTGVTAQQLAAGADAGRILFHPALEAYDHEPSTTVLSLRTGNPNCHAERDSSFGLDILESVSKALITYLKKGKPTK